MFITHRASPGELLSQLLFLSRSTSEDTKGFKRLAHNNDLCPVFHDKVESILQLFNRHKTSALDIQGFRDNGADILFRFEDEEGNKDAVALQVKSQKEIEDDIKRGEGKSSLVKDLKAQRTDAQSKHQVSKFYILLCCDISVYRDYVRKVAAEFTSLDDVKIVSPQYAMHFYGLDEVDIAAHCSRILCRRDYVVTKAVDELADTTQEHRQIVIGAMVDHLEGELEFSLDDLYGYTEATSPESDDKVTQRTEVALQEFLWNGFLQSDHDGETFTLRASDYPALRALYFDLNVRHGITGNHAVRYLTILTASRTSDDDE